MYIDRYHCASSNKVTASKVGRPLTSKGQEANHLNDSYVEGGVVFFDTDQKIVVTCVLFPTVLDPNTVMFDNIEDIPKNLMQSVIDNYKKVIEIFILLYLILFLIMIILFSHLYVHRHQSPVDTATTTRLRLALTRRRRTMDSSDVESVKDDGVL